MTVYIGEIRMFAGNFAPAGWMFCQGQTIPISENDALFQLIGTTYGGDGEETFKLPNLASRVPLHQGTGFIIGQTGGVEDVTLSIQQMTGHTHAMLATTSVSSQTSPANNVVAQSSTGKLYVEDTPTANLANPVVGMSGGGWPHTNLQPYLCVNFIISLFGVFPTPT
ncbi:MULTISPECIES: tail fiber protein [unclassified Mesorhizobium]|uniref:phage tail protein n=1 Tax=unclassified Mesorhizobium TaxID=325217 RepID=UPI000FC99C10|nr:MULTISPECIES: tail fiber protein [unclassified Mesorhizobium]RUX73368.1 phage tail protein [Mesorhizobium sp. M7A.F.Ca.US.005.03.1.1]RUY01685.1 phage tail protein [Mesorhizobium sp. M7A.F.Ca.US.005.03.2.1]RUY29040.1 phage tail protein [Mesorhizobium sp. M7A.F.Ca.US.001.04.2.1]RUY43986.1 phage tail protein [Mesorhizobium sp. M7A.F.Ca.US.001.04.1.1]RUZ00535.1 phage tail protein [Mesorhizobium sp. M7A.F.Ca.CA.001.12.2.1]